MSTSPNFVSSVNTLSSNLIMTDLVQGGGVGAGETLNQGQFPKSVTVFTAGSNGSWLRALNVYSNSTRKIRVAIKIFESGANNCVLGVADLPPNLIDADISHGLNMGTTINLMDPAFIPGMDFSPNRGLRLKPGTQVQLSLVVPETPFFYEESGVDDTPVTTALSTLKSSFPEVGMTSEKIFNEYGEPIGLDLKLNSDTPGFFTYYDQNGTAVYSRDGRHIWSDEALTGTDANTYFQLIKRANGSRLARSAMGFESLTFTGFESVSKQQLMGSRLSVDAEGAITYDGSTVGQIAVTNFNTPPSLIYMFPNEVLNVSALGGDF